MRKERIILDRLGTLFILSLFPFFAKMAVTCTLVYLLHLLPRFYDCILYAAAVYASDNLNILNKMAEIEFPSQTIVFIQMATILVSVVGIVISMSVSPLIAKTFMFSDMAFKIFANVFFTVAIGIGWGFLTSYSLKSSY
jgi:hypothetical protein